MSETLSQDLGRPAEPKPVLLWLAEGDESHIKPDLAQASEFLGVSPEAIEAAIVSGEPLQGWFVDWAATPSNS